jgi:predicted ATPase
MPSYILTGTPGAGKTAILRLLELRGYAVVEEAATDVIAVDHALGHDQMSDLPAFIDKIVLLQRHRQAGAPSQNGATIVFDRSPICTLALSRYSDLAPSRLLRAEIDRILAHQVYQPTVFFVRNQGFVRATPARRISFADALRFERIHEDTYTELGFRLVEVPAVPLAIRVALVTQTIERLHPEPSQPSAIAASRSVNVPVGPLPVLDVGGEVGQ